VAGGRPNHQNTRSCTCKTLRECGNRQQLCQLRRNYEKTQGAAGQRESRAITLRSLTPARQAGRCLGAAASWCPPQHHRRRARAVRGSGSLLFGRCGVRPLFHGHAAASDVGGPGSTGTLTPQLSGDILAGLMRNGRASECHHAARKKRPRCCTPIPRIVQESEFIGRHDSSAIQFSCWRPRHRIDQNGRQLWSTRVRSGWVWLG
jgi:hypothetical protein